MTNKKSKAKTPDVGPFAERFAKFLEIGLHCFEENFEDFNPCHVLEEKNGKGVMFSQFKEKDYGRETSEEYTVIAFEHGIVWPSGASICFSNEQSPEQVALLFIAALSREMPVNKPTCGNCETKGMFSKGGGLR